MSLFAGGLGRVGRSSLPGHDRARWQRVATDDPGGQSGEETPPTTSHSATSSGNSALHPHIEPRGRGRDQDHWGGTAPVRSSTPIPAPLGAGEETPRVSSDEVAGPRDRGSPRRAWPPRSRRRTAGPLDRSAAITLPYFFDRQSATPEHLALPRMNLPSRRDASRRRCSERPHAPPNARHARVALTPRYVCAKCLRGLHVMTPVPAPLGAGEEMPHRGWRASVRALEARPKRPLDSATDWSVPSTTPEPSPFRGRIPPLRRGATTTTQRLRHHAPPPNVPHARVAFTPRPRISPWPLFRPAHDSLCRGLAAQQLTDQKRDATTQTAASQ
jgi:hypothetical protein